MDDADVYNEGVAQGTLRKLNLSFNPFVNKSNKNKLID